MSENLAPRIDAMMAGYQDAAILLTAVLAMAQTARADYFSDRQQQQERRDRAVACAVHVSPPGGLASRA